MKVVASPAAESNSRSTDQTRCASDAVSPYGVTQSVSASMALKSGNLISPRGSLLGSTYFTGHEVYFDKSRYLARSAYMPRGLYVLLALIFF